MLLSALSLAISVSIDSLGIGITYGLRNTKVSTIAKFVLFLISLFITTISIYLGNVISHFLPSVITKLIGVILLVSMGCFIIYEAIRKKNSSEDYNICYENNYPKTHQIFIKSLGITIKIIRNPIYSDLDNSKLIDAKEAFYLGLALSIDSMCVGIGSSIIGLGSLSFPFFASIFQLIFLSIGIVLGKKVISSSKIPENTWSILSGLLLILIGISRLFIS